jgi:hypothetical protein
MGYCSSVSLWSVGRFFRFCFYLVRSCAYGCPYVYLCAYAHGFSHPFTLRYAHISSLSYSHTCSRFYTCVDSRADHRS